MDALHTSATPPNDDEAARIAALTDSVDDVVRAAVDGDTDGTKAALAQLRQVGSQIDPRRMLDAVHVPDDAGDDADQLSEILSRIPDGWGRWIRCERGWYDLVVDLHRQLVAVVPDYAPHQIKEKYGSLHFYWESRLAVNDPNDPVPSPPPPNATAEQEAEWEHACEDHQRRLETYLASEEGQRRQAEFKARFDQAKQLVGAAEQASTAICERCGAAGELHLTRGSSPWRKTLCAACAAAATNRLGEPQEYLTAAEWQAWWDEEGPRIRAEQQQRAIDHFVASHQNKQVLVAWDDSTQRLREGVEATYVHDADEARELVERGGWDEIWFDADEVGAAVVQALDARYKAWGDQQRAAKSARQRVMSGYIPPPDGAPRTTYVGALNSDRLDTAPLHHAGISIQCWSRGVWQQPT